MYLYFSRLRLFIFSIFMGIFFILLMPPFTIRIVFSFFNQSTILLFVDISFPRFNFFTIYLLQLSFYHHD